MEPGGNSGIFAWSDAKPFGNRLPKGLEIQMLELDWVKLHAKKGKSLRPLPTFMANSSGQADSRRLPTTPEAVVANRSRTVAREGGVERLRRGLRGRSGQAFG